MDTKLVRAIINRYMDFRKLVESDGYYVAPNGTMFCPFHPNSNTKAAHFYENEDGSGQIFCFAEYRQYTPYDFYTILHPNIDTIQLAQAIWNKLPKTEQDAFITNLGIQQEHQELPYIDSLVKFKNGEINFKQLLGAIHLSLPVDETIQMVEKLYNLPAVSKFTPTNKYLYFMQNYPNQYKLISAYQIINAVPDLPDFVYQHLMSVGDCILIPNFIDNQIYSITFRSLKSDKRFLKYGEFTTLMYNLGNLPLDFKYGTPLIIVEGNLDTDIMRQIYPYTLGALSANLTRNHIQLLGHLTNKIILAFDNDAAGIRGMYSAIKKLPDMQVYKFKHFQTLKDLGDIVDLEFKGRKDEASLIRNQYKNQITLINSN